MADDNPESLVELDKVEKRFGTFVALQPTTLTLRQGEFLTLLGPSGCGKSTLLRVLGGFEPASGGRVLLRGRDITGLPPERRPFNMVFQSYALFPHLTVAGNLAYGLRVMGLDAREVDRRTDEMLDLIHLPHLRNRMISELSGGQQQRVALARALVKRPDVLLLDEPLSALDLKLRRHLQTELRQIQRQLGTTFVFVTHDQEEAMSMSHRICLMDHGRIRQLGTPREIYDFPTSEYAARFVGDANLLPGVVQAVDGPHALLALDAGGRVSLKVAGDPVVAGDRANAMLRPEHLVLNAPADRAITGVIRDVIFFGPFKQVTLRLSDGRDLEMRASQETPIPEEGSAVAVGVMPDRGLILRTENQGSAK